MLIHDIRGLINEYLPVKDAMWFSITNRSFTSFDPYYVAIMFYHYKYTYIELADTCQNIGNTKTPVFIDDTDKSAYHELSVITRCNTSMIRDFILNSQLLKYYNTTQIYPTLYLNKLYCVYYDDPIITRNKMNIKFHELRTIHEHHIDRDREKDVECFNQFITDNNDLVLLNTDKTDKLDTIQKIEHYVIQHDIDVNFMSMFIDLLTRVYVKTIHVKYFDDLQYNQTFDVKKQIIMHILNIDVNRTLIIPSDMVDTEVAMKLLAANLDKISIKFNNSLNLVTLPIFIKDHMITIYKNIHIKYSTTNIKLDITTDDPNWKLYYNHETNTLTLYFNDYTYELFSYTRNMTTNVIIYGNIDTTIKVSAANYVGTKYTFINVKHRICICKGITSLDDIDEVRGLNKFNAIEFYHTHSIWSDFYVTPYSKICSRYCKNLIDNINNFLLEIDKEISINMPIEHCRPCGDDEIGTYDDLFHRYVIDGYFMPIFGELKHDLIFKRLQHIHRRLWDPFFDEILTIDDIRFVMLYVNDMSPKFFQLPEVESMSLMKLYEMCSYIFKNEHHITLSKYAKFSDFEYRGNKRLQIKFSYYENEVESGYGVDCKFQMRIKLEGQLFCGWINPQFDVAVHNKLYTREQYPNGLFYEDD